MIASLPMYDRPETAAANDRLWQAIRHHLGEGPDTLLRGGGLFELWLSPDLIFSQTCGYPFRSRLHGHVTLIGTPDYDLPGCPAGHYNSVFVARLDDERKNLVDFEDAVFAYNEGLSQSGWAAPQNHAQARGITFHKLLQSGGHRFSALAVAEGKADVASIDALTWEMLQRHDSFTTGLREVERTDPTPGLPYITAKSRNAAVHYRAIVAAIADLSEQERYELHLKGMVEIPTEDYLAIPNPAAPDFR